MTPPFPTFWLTKENGKIKKPAKGCNPKAGLILVYSERSVFKKP